MANRTCKLSPQERAEVDAMLETLDLRDAVVWRRRFPKITDPEWSIIERYARKYPDTARFEWLCMTADHPVAGLRSRICDLNGRRLLEAKGHFVMHSTKHDWNYRTLRAFLIEIVKARYGGEADEN